MALEQALEPTPGAPPIMGRLSSQVFRLAAQMNRACDPLFRRYKVETDSARILVMLLERGASNVGALVERMALPQSTVSHQLQRLERLGYIARRRAAHDRRSVEVVLTDLGVEVARATDAVSIEVYRAMTAGMTEADIAAVAREMETMIGRLAASPIAGPETSAE